VGLGNYAGARCSRLTLKKFLFGFLAALIVPVFVTASAEAASVITDTTDYPPGATVTISGSGFSSNENVSVHVTHYDGSPVGGEGHDPWTVRTNFSGGLITSWVVPYDDNDGEILLVTATGQTSLLTATTTFADAVQVNLDQLHNGNATSSPEWANGNINTTNSCYAENDGVPFRYFIEGLAGGTHHYFTIQMEWTKGGINAYDYTVDYDLTEGPPIDSAGGPCGTISTSPPGDCDATLSTYAFRDPTVSANYISIPAGDSFPAGFSLSSPANLKFYNASIDSLGHYFFTGTASDRELNFIVYFQVADTASVGFYWAGHMAHGVPGKWGAGNGSGSVSGAPYHMRTKDLDGGGGKNQDRSIQNGALCLPPQATFSCAASSLSCANLSSSCTADDLSGNSYFWQIVGATIDSGQGTTTIYYTATASDWVHITLEACDTTGGCPGDFCCNEFTDSVQVEADTTDPQFVNCPSDMTVQCDAVLAPSNLSGTDNCDPSPVITYLGETVTPGSCPQSYTITRKWEIKDASGNADTCVQAITVQDTSAPVISGVGGPSTIQCPSTPTFSNPTASDACDQSPSLTFNDVTTPGVCPQEYSVTRTWTATDDCGNSSQASQTITVEDNTAPAISALPGPSSIECPATPAFTTPTATDACDPSPSLTFNDVTSPGACPQEYSVTRTWTATDHCNNSSQASQTISVTDNAAPVISALPGPSSVECPATPVFTTPIATDACDPSPSLTFNDVTTPGACPQEYSVTRSWTATDDCNNSSQASQTISVTDNTAPVISGLPGPSSVECPATPAFTTPTATDACDPSPSLTFNDVTTPGACPQEYSVTRTWTAIDDCGNSSQASQTISVTDNTAPVISGVGGPSTIQCPATLIFSNPTATDACDATPTLTFNDVTTSGACPQEYSVTRTWTATDDCGNSSQASQTITVEDNTAPVISTLPGPSSAECPATSSFTTPTATDACDPAPSLVFNDVTTPGACPQEYSVTRTWTATDACGNSSQASQTISVTDNTAPAISGLPGASSVECPATPVFTTPTATDACDPSPSLTFNDVTTPGACPQEYSVTRTWTATDACGNSSQASQTISVTDNTAPVISALPGASSVECPATPVFTTPTATDACDPAPSLVFADVTNPGACPQEYSTTRTWTATDACGNSSQKGQTISVTDNTAPVISGVGANQTIQCPAAPTFSNPTATDACDATPTLTFNDVTTPGNCPQEYSRTRTWTATDDCGNSSQASQTITVEDNTAPVISGVGGPQTIQCPATPTFSNPTATDACDATPTLTFNDVTTPGNCPQEYSMTRTWTATDDCGNSTQASQTITVVDPPPVAQCPTTLEDVIICQLSDSICIPGIGFGCSDACNNNVTSTLNGVPYNPGDIFCFVASAEGLQTLMLICTDECGHADSCTATFNVTVDRTVCPCPDITIEKVHDVIQGQYEEVSVVIDNMSYPIGGLNLLIEYDASALNLTSVLTGDFITTCGWEYFTYRNGACGDCGSSACPSGKVRITAIAEINNGANHPSCFLLEPAEVAKLVFLVTNDRTFECQFVPIRFSWCDCRDNTLSSVTGDTLYISSSVNDYFADGVYNDITDISAPFPGHFGANTTCDVELEDGKPNPIRCIDFFNGGIDIICADSIDDRGDINMNGVPNEVADAVLLGNYFIYGLGVFTVNVQGQIAASDVNADGAVLSVADLVYLIRVVVGDAQPFNKVAVPVSVKYTISSDGRLSVDKNVAIGAAFVMVQGQVEPVLLANQMELKSNFDGISTRILVWSINGNSFTGDFLQVNGQISSIEMATAEGNPVALNVIPTEFTLHQNYPNPFNPKTIISFTLPSATDYNLVIYNVNGQQVATFSGVAESAGTFEIEWEAGNFASGIYFYKLIAGPHVDMKKMILLK